MEESHVLAQMEEFSLDALIKCFKHKKHERKTMGTALKSNHLLFTVLKSTRKHVLMGMEAQLVL